ncbi:MAG TPA: SigE family RNA polymerase sigma factor [Mycobacteriales bacterium]|jgi:RNA polymerase sigma-70 factor (sigma-E family)|nr:SigE family RNA polymerase sigma factor [Mycobacteriales bacterium]
MRVVGDETTSDRSLLAGLFVADYDKLVRLARLLGDPGDAEDVVQSAFIRVYRRGRLRDPAQAGAYLRRTVVNLTRSAWRRKQTARRHAAALAPDEVSDPDVAGQLAIRAAIAALPRRQREAVVLRYFADLSEAATADLMRVSIGSVKSYTSRGLARLGELLAGSPS